MEGALSAAAHFELTLPEYKRTFPAKCCTTLSTMSIRIIPDKDKPSAAVEIALDKPLPDYDLEQMDQPTPRDVDAILVSQGFRDLTDDARGVLMELLANPPREHHHGVEDLEFTHPPSSLELVQLTGAICPGNDEVYRPGLWIVIRDSSCKARTLPGVTQERIAAIIDELVKRLQIE
ncbi:MAG TPA: hypothetical protein VGI16_13745 [Candidatus Acidoferrum sp.]